MELSKKSLINTFTIIVLCVSILSCSYFSLSISDILDNKITTYCKEKDNYIINPDIQNLFSEKTSVCDFTFLFLIHHKNTNLDNNFTYDFSNTNVISGDSIQIDNISIITEKNNEYNILPYLTKTSLSLYKESELILFSENNILELPDNIFNFSGNYSLVVTFCINEIIQEAIFIINL